MTTEIITLAAAEAAAARRRRDTMDHIAECIESAIAALGEVENYGGGTVDFAPSSRNARPMGLTATTVIRDGVEYIAASIQGGTGADNAAVRAALRAHGIDVR